MISLLGKRVFLLHNVHDSGSKIFHTRWAMNYLPGPDDPCADSGCECPGKGDGARG
jgi:hypothetical protein